ncbi:MAG: 5-formyltetrahydrofolate cyclo-ligase, partial [Nocardiaceae bacterium]|nr:5-formyltetrahydrofolate cyclo-ligase [Nocardiaceae bacterium]
MNVPTKAEWRTRVLRERRAVPPETKHAEAEALVAFVTSVPTDPEVGSTICAYVPVGSEPGSLDMLDALRDAGRRVLLPVTGEPGPLEWAE